MKKLIASLSVWLFALHSFAGDSIVLGSSTFLESEIMGEDRPFMVYLPPTYGVSENLYPVIYLLDGDIHRFKGFVGVLESLSTETLDKQVQESIVVAVPNTNRSRDLTPSPMIEWKFKNQILDTFTQTGNAKQFRKFLESELIPAIDAAYRTSQKRVLVGESFGGLFAADTLLKSPSVFTDYLIIDPTSLWDNNYLNREFNSSGKVLNSKSRVYFAFANNSHLGEIGLTNYKWGTTFASSVIDAKKGMSQQQYFENETHGTVALLAWYNGLKVLLPFTK
ncbi:alpha/beta hydrolase [Alteromonas portus]|uniref:alpha/beta hydrolase n=1 Tax=Alteromonas portus TaxID=2565549 RepID=UPI003BF86450